MSQPGKRMSGDASVVDYSPLPHARRIELLAAMQRTRARLDAQEQVLLATLQADPIPDGNGCLDKEWVREDVACAMTLPPVVAQQRLDVATALVTRLPATLSMLGRGQISRLHAVRLVQAVQNLPDAAAREVQARVLDRAPQQTVAQFGVWVRRAVLTVDPRGAEDQHRDAVAQRRVVFTDQDHGVTECWALLPTDAAAQLAARLSELVAQWAPLPDGRSSDQLRADALTHLALHRTDSDTGPGPGTGVDGGGSP